MKKTLLTLKKHLILCFLLLLTGFAFSQTATPPSSGDGTEGNPYQIASLNNLYWLSQNSAVWDKYFVQTADIDATTTTGWDSGKGFTPIGNGQTYFSGSYNGKGHEIANIFINRASSFETKIGFIGALIGKVDSLGLYNVNISGGKEIGAIAGINCGTINECYSSGAITAVLHNSTCGGLVGANGTFVNSTIGYVYGTISDCYSMAQITGIHLIGGLVGHNSNGTTQRCYCTGTVTTSMPETASYGGLVGYNSGTVSNCFWDTESSGLTTSLGGYGKTTAQMQSQATFTSKGWFFNCDNQDNTWAINNSGGGYPFLGWQAPHYSDNALPTIIGECSVSITNFPKASNICGESLEATTTDPLEYNEVGTHYITWTCDFGGGVIVSQNQKVIVEDNNAPIPDTEDLNTIVSQCAINITDIPTATDVCAGEITGTTEDPLFYDKIGTFHINWEYEDEGGNIASQEQIVVIQKYDTKPSVKCIGNQNKEISTSKTVYTVIGTEFGPTETTDNCSIASVVNDFNDTETLNGAEFPIGTTTVTWTITDAVGNTSECSFDIIVSHPTGINELEQLGISIYPNPVNGILNITCDSENIQKISILDITGKTLFEKSNISGSEQIDMSGLNSGIYFIRIDSGNEVYTNKIIKR